jgi:hypothetical protein
VERRIEWGPGAIKGAQPAGVGGNRPGVATCMRAEDERGGVRLGWATTGPLPWAGPKE